MQFFAKGAGRQGRAAASVRDQPRGGQQAPARARAQQSEDMRANLIEAGVHLVQGEGRLDGPQRDHRRRPPRAATDFDRIEADTLVISVGATPRVLPTARARRRAHPHLDPAVRPRARSPEHLIVVGSGVTGAEFASAYRALGAKVTLISSRDQVLPGEDADAASVIEKVFKRNGMKVVNKSRAESVVRDGDGVVATLTDGREVRGSHCLMAVGSDAEHRRHRPRGGRRAARPRAGTSVSTASRARRCRTSTRPATAPTFLPLASVASMQGRTAVFHAMGDIVNPPEVRNITSNIFTQPEIATVGWTAEGDRGGRRPGRRLQAAARLEPARQDDGHPRRLREALRSSGSGTIIGGVIVAPKASELIFPLALAVEHRLTVDQFAEAFPVYPSLTGSLTDAARAMHVVR